MAIERCRKKKNLKIWVEFIGINHISIDFQHAEDRLRGKKEENLITICGAERWQRFVVSLNSFRGGIKSAVATYWSFKVRKRGERAG